MHTYPTIILSYIYIPFFILSSWLGGTYCSLSLLVVTTSMSDFSESI